MQVSFGSVWLTGSEWQEGAASVVWTAAQAVEVTPIVAALSPRVRGRGNYADEIAVTVNLSFPTAADVLDFCLNLPWSLPANGALVLVEGSATWTFAQAAFARIERQRFGELAARASFVFKVEAEPTLT